MTLKAVGVINWNTKNCSKNEEDIYFSYKTAKDIKIP